LVLIFTLITVNVIWAASLKIGSKIPQINGKTLTGKQFNQSNYTDKFLLIDIGSTMCIPCQDTLKQFQKLHLKFKDAGLVVLSINIDGELFKKNVEKFIKDNKISFPIVFDATKKISNAFGAETIPFVILVDKSGKIIKKIEGVECDIEK